MPDLHERIGALSWQSRSTLSRAPEYLAALPQAGNNLEQLTVFSDAQVVTGPGLSPLKNPKANIVWGENFDSVWSNFTTLSKALDADDPSRGMKARLEDLPQSPKNLKLLYLNRSGASAGSDTFVDAVFKAVGVQNVVSTSGWQSPDIETLLRLSPDVIVTSFMDSDYAGVNDRTVRHTALSDYLSDIPRIDIPGALWPCAGPGLVDAAEILSAELAKL